MATIPVLKLNMLDGYSDKNNQFISLLTEAAHDVGFFYLSDHGVSPSFLEKVRELTRKFFLLPEKEKLSIAMINSPHFRGYNRAGNERTNGNADWREQFDIGAEREPHNVTDNDPIWLGLHGYNQWPESLPELKNVMLAYNDILTNISLKLLRALATGLGLPNHSFDEIYGETPNEHIKLIKYPHSGSIKETQGVGAHKDSGLLTLILQDENKGLQVEISDNKWIDVPPINGTFVVNLGELLELATNGYLRATVHRVLTPDEQRDRFSIAYFLGASLDSIVPVFDLPKELTSGRSLIKTDPNNPLLRNVGLNYMKGRLRSHPDVAKKFYSKWSNFI
ncbi:Iron/ascorbate-dependent oxidoreductase [Xenorhabdus poinarii G6]|uniref:2-oxoglutarate-dependent ethylene/succinate-forming enzyme n=1 Tax=Xenorhabdus poinarii G6 TaxID=1354304 RepID=A0A068R565_9GAMM|nr:2-oxoglutarate and iron-dependent oxygenase domain-containing protein [Xenorhabdus poinarii]CDG22338.1 Iron/ascorbate-dependent oxidoreductase [Xenorhabdus poinarii G6]